MTLGLLRWVLAPVCLPRALAWLLWLWAGFTIGLLVGLGARPVRAEPWEGDPPAAEWAEAAAPAPPAPPAFPLVAPLDPAPRSVPELIVHYARHWGAPGIAGRADRVAWCESKYLNIANRGGSGAKGVFQFMDGTWSSASRGAGWGGSSVWDVPANVAVALWLMARGEWHHWRACL